MLAIDPSEILPPNLRRDIPLAEALRFEAKRRARAARICALPLPPRPVPTTLVPVKADTPKRTMMGRGRIWTPEESALLIALVNQGMAACDIYGRIPGRSSTSILGRARRLGIKMIRVCRTRRRSPEAQVNARLLNAEYELRLAEEAISIERKIRLKRGLRLHTIISACADAYEVPYADIISARRTAEVMRPRQVVYYLARTMTLRSFPEIGRMMGDRDHTTVLSGFRKIIRLVQTDAILAEEIRIIRASLESPPAAQSVAA